MLAVSYFTTKLIAFLLKHRLELTGARRHTYQDVL